MKTKSERERKKEREWSYYCRKEVCMIGLCQCCLVVRNWQSCQMCVKDNYYSLHVGLCNVCCLLYTATLLCKESIVVWFVSMKFKRKK